MPVVLRSASEADLADALHWYEDRVPGLGLEFLRTMEATFALLERSPELFPVVHKDLRRALVRRFPFSVYYLLRDGDVVVVGCLHNRSHPRRWQRRA